MQFRPQIEVVLFCIRIHLYCTMSNPHILIVTLPVQGHINPTLQLAKLLIRAGAHVTFFPSASAGSRMSKSPNLDGLEFATFSDGYDHGLKQGDDVEHFVSSLSVSGPKLLLSLSWPVPTKVVPLLAYSMVSNFHG
ncbi:UDP-glycosyltransferase 75C1 [Vitis vinifera]|uniref:UDP-glycosyltransferase 75C1 n=1 Tax=Vitis vinifera TaxID=29760 RepID=A0A438CGF7_VITVI|nr:UDP-glycosyltransferase 75C1 [Vitis vinifera]